MPKCRVTTALGEHLQVEADSFDVLPDNGFVVLKRNEQVQTGTPASPINVPRAVALFYRPDKVLLVMDPPAQG